MGEDPSPEFLFNILPTIDPEEPTFFVNNNIRTDTKPFIITGGEKEVAIKKRDVEILQILASNARITSSEISKELNISPSIVRYRIKRLEDLGIIKGYRVGVNYQNIDYQGFKVDIFLKEHKYKNKIVEFIQRNPYLFSINETTGSSHLELELKLADINQLHEIMKELNEIMSFIVLR